MLCYGKGGRKRPQPPGMAVSLSVARRRLSLRQEEDHSEDHQHLRYAESIKSHPDVIHPGTMPMGRLRWKLRATCRTLGVGVFDCFRICQNSNEEQRTNDDNQKRQDRQNKHQLRPSEPRSPNLPYNSTTAESTTHRQPSPGGQAETINGGD